MAWIFSDAVETFRHHHRLWNELNALSGAHILLDAESVQIQLDLLVDRPVLLARQTASSSAAMLLLVQTGLGRWTSFQPSQQPIGHALFASRNGIEDLLVSLVRGLPGCALLLGITRQDPDASLLPQGDGLALLQCIRYDQTGRVMLQPDFDAYWRQRPEDLRSGIKRRQRRLQREGRDWHLVVLDQPDQVEAGIRGYGQLEGSGWKGRIGTSVDAAGRQGLYYTALLKAHCRRGEGSIYQLMLDEQLVASQICVGRGRMSVSLKMAYDEQFRRDGPGYELQARIIEHLHRRPGVEAIEFYGRATAGWTSKWTHDLRWMFHLNVYRHPLVRQGLDALRSIQRQPAAAPAGLPAD